MDMKIKSTFMKSLLSKIITKQVKKAVGEDCQFTLLYFDITSQADGALESELHCKVRMRPEDLKKLLEKKEII